LGGAGEGTEMDHADDGARAGGFELKRQWFSHGGTS
jgi:hypothetical protein